MLKLKNSVKRPKLNKEELAQQSLFSKNTHLSVSLEMLTDSCEYCFAFFTKNIREEIEARRALEKLLCEICHNSWLELGRRSRKQFGGYEKIPYDACARGLFKKSDLTPDVDVWSFVFDKARDYRLLAYKKPQCDVVYILGCDFNHSVYDHGS